jgi:hypothetical protein
VVWWGRGPSSRISVCMMDRTASSLAGFWISFFVVIVGHFNLVLELRGHLSTLYLGQVAICAFALSYTSSRKTI